MIDIIRRSGLLIPKKYENEQFYWTIKEFLTRRTRKYNTPDFTVNKFYVENDDFLIVPRFFPIEKFVSCNINDLTDEGQPINIQHHIVPRNDTQKRAIEHLLKSRNSILELEPGVGKTVVSIYMVAERRKKTFILLHRDSLADQWKGEKNADPPQGFLSFTNLTESDVKRLTSSTFEEDLKKPVVICTDQTFTSLLKRNRYKFLKALDQAGIGIFIGDEVHTSVGAPTFSECSIYIPAKYVYGLSATPYRWDGNGDIIRFHLGKVFIDEDVEGLMSAKVTVLLLDYGIDTPKRFRYLHWAGEFQRARYLNLIKRSKAFIGVSKSLLKKFKVDRDVLFIAERLKLIDLLFDWLKCSSKSKFTGSAKIDQLKFDIVFATPLKIRDGVDVPRKDTLIISSPVSNIKQLTGRVLRPKKGKKEPIVIDMVDIGCEDIRRTVHSRLNFYKKKGWKVQFVVVFGKKIKVIDYKSAMEILKGE